MSLQFCPKCGRAKSGSVKCPVCGYREDRYQADKRALPLGSMVGAYQIGILLEVNRQAQFYTAVDIHDGSRVVVEEFLPYVVMGRMEGAAATKIVKHEESVKEALRAFAESRQDRGTRFLTAVKENGTVYRVYSVDKKEPEEIAKKMVGNPIFFREKDGTPRMSITAIPMPPMPPQREFRGQGKPTKRKSWLRWGIPLLIVLLLAAVGSYFYFFNGNVFGKKPTDMPEPAAVPTAAVTEEPSEVPATEEPTAVPTTEAATEEPTEVPATEEPTAAPATETVNEEPAAASATEAATEEPVVEQVVEAASEKHTEAPVTPVATEEPTATPEVEVKTEEPTVTPESETKTEEPKVTPAAEKKTEKPTATPATEAETEEPTATPEAEVKTEETTATPVAEAETEEPTATPAAEAETEEPTATPEAEVKTEETTATPEAEVKTEETTATPEAEVETEEPTATPAVEAETEEPTATPAAEAETEEPTATPAAEAKTEIIPEKQTEKAAEKPTENTVPPEMESLTAATLNASIKALESVTETPEPEKTREPFVCPEENDPWWDSFRERITAALYPSDTSEKDDQYSSPEDKEYDFLLDIYKIILHPDSTMPDNDFVNLIKTSIKEVNFQKYIRYFVQVSGKKDDPEAESLNKLLDFLEEAEKEEPESEEETADAEKTLENPEAGKEEKKAEPDQSFLVNEEKEEPKKEELKKDSQAGKQEASKNPEDTQNPKGTENTAKPKESPAPEKPKETPSPTAGGPKWKNGQNQNSDNGNISITRKKAVPTEEPEDLSLTDESTGEEGEGEKNNE